MDYSNFAVVSGIAFLGGLLSFLSPCVLPLVPGYISLISGISIDNLKNNLTSSASARRAVLINSLAFNAGLSLIFVSLGAGAGLVGASLISNRWVRIVGGLIIVAFGLQLMGLLKISGLYRDTRFFSNEKPRGPLGSFTLGIAFAAGWTPCIGPILGGIIGLAATSGGWQRGFILSLFYAAGLAIPFLITGFGINRFLQFYANFRRHLHKVEVISGFVLVLVGILIAFNLAVFLTSSKLTRVLPNAEAWLGTSVKVAPTTTVTPKTSESYEVAPNVELTTLEGAPFHLDQLRGHVVLLNFWATWCVPCRGEIPELNALERDLAPSGLIVVGVSNDDSAQEIAEFQKDVKQDYKLLVGNSEAREQFDTGAGLPFTYILDRDGHIRQKIRGARDRAGYEAVIKPLLTESVAAR